MIFTSFKNSSNWYIISISIAYEPFYSKCGDYIKMLIWNEFGEYELIFHLYILKDISIYILWSLPKHPCYLWNFNMILIFSVIQGWEFLENLLISEFFSS